jgi:UDP-N-acetylglucosamine acyltransferase
LSVHPTAIVSADAEIAGSAEIGPYCIVEGPVTIGERTFVESHARIGSRYGRVTIGADNMIEHGAALGGPAQDYSYREARTSLEIGDGNRIGQFCTISLGTQKGVGITRIGNENFLMAFVHLGHDCQVEDHVTIVNATQIAGHVTIGHHALLSGQGGVTQHVRLGAYSFLAGASYANKDIPPYMIAEGHWAVPKAVNRMGLKRAGFTPATRRNIESAARILLDRRLTIGEVAERIGAEHGDDPAVAELIAFLRDSSRGVARG